MSDKKKFYESKAFWGAVLLFIGGGLNAIGLAEISAILMTLGGALGIYGIRTATQEIE